jgi:iron complex outermembrane recepter protein
MTYSAKLRLLLTLLPLAVPAIARADEAPPAAAQPAQPAAGANNPYVIVTGQREQEANYRIDTLQDPGPLGTTPILNQPYSISVLPQDLIENSQATDFKDVSKYLPLVAYQEQQGPEILRPQTRGMQGGNFQNTRLDGMQMFITVATPMELFQEIQVVNGPTASLYGPANPSGMFNFVSKRPTDHPLYDFEAAYASDGIVTGKMDVGGPIDRSGIFSYRVNALYGSGDGWVDHSHERRALGSAAIDVRPWDRGVLELNYSNYSITNLGYPGWFTYNEKIDLPPAPDPTRVGYGQSYAGVDLITKNLWTRFKQDFGSNWHFVAGFLNQDASRNINTPVNNLTSDTGNYTSSFANGFAPRFIMDSDVAYLNNTFDALGMSHDLTLGTAGYKARSFAVSNPATPASVLLGKASIAEPMIFPEPPQGPPNVLVNFDSSNSYQQGVNIGDLIRFDSHWSTRLGVSQDWFSTKNYNKTGKQISEYSNNGLSPTASLLFNPVPDQTAYFTYSSSLQAGDLAPAGTVNAGQSLPPYRSSGYEVGYKAFLANINLTAAAFRINRPFANINTASNVFEITGEQVNTGLELSAVGEIVHGLTLYGGLTLLDARMQNTPLPSTDDKWYVGAPKWKGNMLFEYAVPGVSGLVASFDYQFTSNRAGNDTNSFWVAGYDLFDIGLRYGTRYLTWRLAVNNLTDRSYWSTVAPSNLTGANTGNLIGHLGSPRTLLASVTLSL